MRSGIDGPEQVAPDREPPTLMTSDAKLKKLCNRCGIWTNQLVLRREETTWNEEIDDAFYLNGGDGYTMLRCLGCDTVSLLHESWNSRETGPNGECKIEERRYPPAAQRREPTWNYPLNGFPMQMGYFLKEIYIALHNQSHRLCAIGIRALLEDIMIHTVGEQGTIGRNIDAFLTKGYVASHSADDFRVRVIGAGHAAMHRGHEPARSDIEALLDITEALIASIYVHPRQLRKMTELPRGRAPLRPRSYVWLNPTTDATRNRR